MKRFSIVVAFAALCLTACQDQNAPAPIQDSYPKKHLIEEFTSQGCGYCPYGMDFVHDFMADDENWILVLHHAGYSPDNFTVKGSTTVAGQLGVNGAPNITINREATTITTEEGTSQAIVFHPAYLQVIKKSQFASTTYASIRINNSYNASSRELTIRVSGALASENYPEELSLNVFVKESGMIAMQQDYINTKNGWMQFRHTNAVRAFLTDARGDLVNVYKQRYEEEYTITLPDSWVAENCMVVAFLTDDFNPVVQAEQQPVVNGTKGGADIVYGGIKKL